EKRVALRLDVYSTPRFSSSAITIRPTAATVMRSKPSSRLPKFCLSTGRTGNVAEASNLRSTCEGDRVNSACGHLGNDTHYAGVVGFGSVDVRKHGIRFGTSLLEESEKPLVGIVGI